ncbi:putative Phox domain, sorting nexin [Lupinus albus]|uniref:Putative Phox domain, sorting nexin n=1 Tax=Lupinus albus TaxID=3870 RepID=A0A6A4QQD5_LUPAL|nr:putative Phox domain, sorting nexin [Lupinus albus]
MGPLTPTPLMDTIYDLIEEAKLRFLWWALCIFSISYFFTHTSKSMWMNIPISIVFVAALRILSNKVEFHWKVQPPTRRTYLSHLEKKQLSPNDARLSSSPPRPKWKKKIDSPVVEAALNDFIDLILKDFVVNLWYSEITSDGEFPEQIRDLVMDALAEVSARVKEINLVDLITRDIVDLIGDHIDLFRRNQAAIGIDVMLTLSSEERDERLKFHLLNSKELHPALISPESEYKVLQQLVSGVLATVLRQREAQCPVIRSIAREIITCLVLQPVLDLASPGYINEVIESLILVLHENGLTSWMGGGDQSTHSATDQNHGHSVDGGVRHDSHTGSADWAQMLEAATQRRTEVLMPENLDNMWTRGKNYNRKKDKSQNSVGSESQLNVGSTIRSESSLDPDMELCFETARHQVDEVNDVKDVVAAANKCKIPLKRSNSAFALGFQTNKGGSTMSELYTSEFEKHGEGFRGKSGQGHFVPKLRCRVMGAYFEKIGSKSFAVYSIAVTNGQEKTWFVKRRYRNFERLHRHLKEIPNYTLHLPPKRIFYSSTEDAFVHQRCIQLNKYLQDLLSIANVAEQHEVWDFLSVSSKSYSFGKSSSMMRTLAVNVDDAVDDIARQFKGVPNGLIRKAGCSTSPTTEGSFTSNTWNSADELDKNISRQIASESVLSSDNDQEVHVDYDNIDGEVAEDNGWHSDNELSSKDYSHQVVNHGKESSNLDQDRKHDVLMEAKVGKDISATNLTLIPDNLEDPDGVPPEWTPPNVSVPILNLVDNIFQLKKRGWLRRQVFWISKQILQLVMEDAIDDWLLREIHWLRREDTVAQGIRWIQDILWPGGTFFVRLRAPQVLNGGSGIDQKPSQTLSESGGIKMAKSGSGSFEQQLEAARRASDVKKLLFDGAPAALVSLIGQKQYRRCASDIYYFSQSSICVKQLAYAIFELLLISIFPEMRNVVMSVHENMHVHQPV